MWYWSIGTWFVFHLFANWWFHSLEPQAWFHFIEFMRVSGIDSHALMISSHWLYMYFSTIHTHIDLYNVFSVYWFRCISFCWFICVISLNYLAINKWLSFVDSFFRLLYRCAMVLHGLLGHPSARCKPSHWMESFEDTPYTNITISIPSPFRYLRTRNWKNEDMSFADLVGKPTWAPKWYPFSYFYVSLDVLILKETLWYV